MAVCQPRGREVNQDLKSSWWHRHLAGAAHRLEACATETKFLVFSTRFFFKLIDLTME
jgi:hypothetical protein